MDLPAFSKDNKNQSLQERGDIRYMLRFISHMFVVWFNHCIKYLRVLFTFLMCKYIGMWLHPISIIKIGVDNLQISSNLVHLPLWISDVRIRQVIPKWQLRLSSKTLPKTSFGRKHTFWNWRKGMETNYNCIRTSIALSSWLGSNSGDTFTPVL